MKRYLVFAWPDFEGSGGMNDLVLQMDELLTWSEIYSLVGKKAFDMDVWEVWYIVKGKLVNPKN